MYLLMELPLFLPLSFCACLTLAKETQDREGFSLEGGVTVQT